MSFFVFDYCDTCIFVITMAVILNLETATTNCSVSIAKKGFNRI